jgi:hypothetical protein
MIVIVVTMITIIIMTSHPRSLIVCRALVYGQAGGGRAGLQRRVAAP